MTSFRSKMWLSALLGVFILLSAATGFAQTVTGTISGTVKDSSGAVLPNAQVEVLNQDTGIARTLQTDAAGHYSALLLPLGNYQVTATVQGFQTEVRRGIELTVGREAVVDMAMAVGAISQKVEVTGEAAVINTTNATVEGLVTGEQIRDLPLNGRSYNDLALLEPGVIYDRMTGSSSQDGFGVRMSVNGARSNNNLYLLDGTVTNDTSQTAGTVNQDSMGVEGIREFVVLTHNYSAEFGRSAGGVVNAVTRSGTNELHGSLYEFLRNSDLDARDFFQVGSVAPFRRNQFGGAIGGKIIKDKLFYFGNYEGFRQILDIPVLGNVPNALAHQGIIPINGQNVNVGVSPLIAPYLALYALPTPGLHDNGDGTAQWEYPFGQPINENYYMERVDYHISDKDNLYARDVYDASSRNRPNPDPYWGVTDQANNYFAQLGETHIFSPNAFNDIRAAFNRTNRGSGLMPYNPAIANLVTPALSFVPGRPLGRIDYSGGGLESWGNLLADPSFNFQNTFEENDTFTLIHGPHSFKFGADLERIQTNLVNQSNLTSSWQFGGIQSFLAAQPLLMDGSKFLGPIPGGGFSTTTTGYRQWLPAWFILDDWRVNSRLTLNLGIRQEFFTDPHEINGLNASLIPFTSPTSTVGPFWQTSKANFAPRAGFAWDPTGTGKTSIRGGVGTYFNEVNIREGGPPADHLYSAVYTFNCNWTGTGTNNCATFPYLPVPTVASLNGAATETMAANHLNTPTIEQYGIDVQRQLNSTMMVRVGYVGWYGYNLTRTLNANDKNVDPNTGLYNTSGAVKPNPAFGTITLLNADAHANYNSLQTMFRKTLSAGLMMQVSYTYSKTLSEADSSANRVTDNTGAGYVTMVPNQLGRDYGLSAYNQKHLLVINSTYELPFARGLKGKLAQNVLGGWEILPIWQYGSGLPFNLTDGFNNSGNGDPTFPDRPNVNPGFTNNPTSGVTQGCAGIPAGTPLHTPNRWFNPCAFSLPPAGTFGNLGRDTVVGPNYDQWNVSLAKRISITERVKLQFRAEFFNLFNHPQFGIVAGQLALFTSSRAYSGSTGVLTQTAGEQAGIGGRNVQLGLKMTF